MTYLKVVSTNRALIGFGLLTAFSTSFGQTFFISLFLPHFLASLSLDESGFGVLYAVGTLSSALLLPTLGAAIDSSDLKRYTTVTVLGLAGSAVLVATAQHAILLGIGIAGLRLSGQGLLGHISHTVMAKAFSQGRGRALALASLGYPLGEALLPITFAGLLAVLDWRTVWWVVVLVSVAMVVPVRSLACGYENRGEMDSPGEGTNQGGRCIRQVLSDSRFYLLLPPILLAPFLLTGMFLYQMPLAASRGWTSEWMAGAFAGFAIARAFSAVAVGPDHRPLFCRQADAVIPFASGCRIAAPERKPFCMDRVRVSRTRRRDRRGMRKYYFSSMGRDVRSR